MGQHSSAVVMDTYQAQSGFCIAPECVGIYQQLRDENIRRDNPFDYCYKWENFVCGEYVPRRPGDPEPVVVTETIVRALFHEVGAMLGLASAATGAFETESPEDASSDHDLGLTARSPTRNGQAATYRDTPTHPLTNLTGNPTHPVSSSVLGAKYDRDPFYDRYTNATFPRPPPPRKLVPHGNSNQTCEQQPDADLTAHLWTLVHRYYDGCMEPPAVNVQNAGDSRLLDLMGEVNVPFKSLDDVYLAAQGNGTGTNEQNNAVKRVTNVEDGDQPMIMAAMTNLAKYGIFPMLRVGVMKSMFDPDEMRINVAPFSKTGLYDGALYKSKHIRAQYLGILKKILPKLHGHHYSRLQDSHKLPENIMKLEERVIKILPKDSDWQRILAHVKERQLWNLTDDSTKWSLDRLFWELMGEKKKAVTKVDVLFEGNPSKGGWDAVFWKIMKKTNKETLRTYFLWQAFLQTLDLWDMEWVQEWREFTQMHLDTKRPVPEREELCVARVQRHFNHVITSRMMNDLFPKKNGREPYFSVAHIDAKVEFPEGCPRYIGDEKLREIYNDAEVRNGLAEASQWENKGVPRMATLSRPETWTHLHDYFALEKLHWRRTWDQLGRRSDDQKCQHLGVSFSTSDR
ncbi:hypothetical protein QQS21_012814 [Conoideocrella luteorostrata]|uniref:Peptidase M13 N-terminal domain-containing protein n=1 Tax=Conoideocrella luteorostrata TaxID=1105319 RepID=A0AAJ0CAG8_9HYPO|nr:hypothetical protein QQS21_012814 [Conoideocrella luteorostrata]